MHSLLARQLKRLGIDPADASVEVEFSQALLERVSKTYGEADQDRYTLERSLTISSREMSELHEGLRAVQVQLAHKNEDLKRALALAQGRQEQLRILAEDLDRRVTERTCELEAAQARLVSSERLVAVGQLAAGVAHEINNPLAYVNVNIAFALAELGQPGGLTPGALADVVEALTQAREGAGRICQTTRDLKVFARGDIERRDPVDLRRTLESCINMVRNEIRHRARLQKDFGPIPLIQANEGRLAQVFINLLLNAAQAIPDGDAETNEIRVATREVGGSAVVEISDTGAGVAPEHLGRLFEPFFTTKPVGVGTGLGLSICHGIVTNLGGTIDVRSQRGHGSTFSVTLPVREVVGSAADTCRTPLPVGRARVLVIDDEPMVLTAITRALSGHDVVPLQDAREALPLLVQDGTFDLILCDLMMPNLSGIELHDMMAAVVPRLRRRVVFLTGGAFTPRAREFLDQVPNRHLEKPFDPDDLRELVGSYAGRARADIARGP